MNGSDGQVAVFLLLIGYPAGRSFVILTDRLLIEPYPRNAWGSWLVAGWAAASLITAIQFVLGTFHFRDRLASSFLYYGVPTLLYAAILLRLISTMFPKLPDDATDGFLLTRFGKRRREIYSYAVALSILPFLMGFTAFEDPLVSVPQISRIAWLAIFSIGFFVPLSRLTIHKVLWLLAFPLILVLFIIFAK